MSSKEVDVQQVLNTVGEPTRFRIIELLSSRPHAVGEVATALGALQPQITKHLQALEAAGVIRVHRLGRRRVARLDRETLARVAAYLGGLARADEDDAALDDYQRAIAREETRLAEGDSTRVLRFERDLPADARSVWEAWTNPARAAQWWAPRHFSVRVFDFEPRAGASIRIVLAEGDAEYESRGHVERVGAGRLVFSLAPVDPAGEPLFEARHDLVVTGEDRAHVRLDIEISAVREDAAPAVAGLRPGWEQLLDALDAFLRTTP
ncbi:Uncharacterized conserved protein YndB, AHSA1/START domain [Actinopolymorpha cephalotaxi]|uniref:Uncharacterized conserved protein YndB, AHSA1/START domain n=1 Tax=Actinopolymorpha cephalotaxi TaxID=504797 RepID=A0A1I3A8J3_9ACTN|nr:metalloregulator ArsR/SmtB family transcription factor [Actinopolymorpha cephalotaxi]NYH85287.1 uncharacterized protein YndB with AHSA1/START domain/DNA-binding transcriptional ArsR family regulator [Actinopolymorpha cephalotaxi]SFH46235.1 Uncharacterized conserved protein YndB, AHSA1/START domain [Actinopolymorpha cephalotaxi]